MKKHFLGATVGLVSLAAMAVSGSSAMAADLPVRAGGYVAPPPQAFSWSGFYLGAHGGYGWGTNDWNVTSVPLVGGTGAASIKTNGLLGGVQAGANHQFGNWVAGIEAEVSVIDAEATGSEPFGGPLFVVGAVGPGAPRSQADWLATFTSRLGYSVDRSLFYLKGGVAGGGFTDDLSIVGPGGFFDSGPQSHTRVGWTAGGGFEYAILDNWSAKVEYDYLDFGSKNENFTMGGLSIIQSVEHKLQVIKLGVNYKFGDYGR